MLRNTTIENEQRVDWTMLGKADTTASHFGGFVGYNWQWDEAVVGVEGNYNRTRLCMSSSDRRDAPHLPDVRRPRTTSRSPAPPRSRITDYGTVRARGGWAVGNFMPYGIRRPRGRARRRVALGDCSPSRDPANSRDHPVPGRPTVGDQDRRASPMATRRASASTGVMQNMFVRAEYEYVTVRLVQRHQPAHPIRARVGARHEVLDLSASCADRSCS